MIARATPTSCCWPPDSSRGNKSFFATILEPFQRVGDDRGAFGLADLSVGERDLEVLVNRQVVEQMILLEDETDIFVAERRTLLGFQMMDGGVLEKIFD